MAPPSPAIDDEGWGHVTVEGRAYKDVKLWPGGARAWDWAETGTDHDGGIRPDDVRELLDHGATHVLLSRGRELRLHVPDVTVDLVERSADACEVLDTATAIARYEALRQAGIAVGALLHTTC